MAKFKILYRDESTQEETQSNNIGSFDVTITHDGNVKTSATNELVIKTPKNITTVEYDFNLFYGDDVTVNDSIGTDKRTYTVSFSLPDKYVSDGMPHTITFTVLYADNTSEIFTALVNYNYINTEYIYKAGPMGAFFDQDYENDNWCNLPMEFIYRDDINSYQTSEYTGNSSWGWVKQITNLSSSDKVYRAKRVWKKLDFDFIDYALNFVNTVIYNATHGAFTGFGDEEQFFNEFNYGNYWDESNPQDKIIESVQNVIKTFFVLDDYNEAIDIQDEWKDKYIWYPFEQIEPVEVNIQFPGQD